MPTITRTTSGMMNPASNDIKSSITAAKANFVSGNTIQAADFNGVIGMWLSWNDHYHETSDYSFEQYGNTPSTGTYYAQDPDYTSPLGNVSGGVDMIPVVAGEVITAAKHEEMRANFNSANDHTHYWDDYTYYGG